MRKYVMAVLTVLLASLSLMAIACSAGEVEYRPGEKAAENLFNKGIGDPWIGGEPFQSDLFKSDFKPRESMQYPVASCQLMGYLNAASGLIIASDQGNSLKLNPGPGCYPVFGCFEKGKLVGLFIDFRLSAS
mgnify:CR=1 FL=1